MPERADADPDRPRSPRFTCGGLATITYVPSNGIFVPGRMRDLSLGGCCVDTTLPIECGARAEIVIHVNSASFRAMCEVRSIRAHSEACIQFVYLSRGGQDLLVNLVGDLAKSQAAMNQLKSARRHAETESFRSQLEEEKLLASMWSERIPVLGSLAPEGVAEISEADQELPAAEEPTAKAKPVEARKRVLPVHFSI